MSEPAPNRVCPMCRARTSQLHCERDGTGTFRVDNIDVLAASRMHAGDLIGQRYRVVRRIGRGGMGAVYQAEHTGSGQHVAVKVLALEPDEASDAEVFFRFYREARITASLKHANTVRLFDFGQSESGALFMAMELLHGPTLQQQVARRIAQGTALTAAEAVAVALPILRSLREAHQAGLVHRDLKPDNVMLAEQGDEDIVVKVLDFGIARSGDSHLTRASHLVGTPAYMSPEQCLGAPLDGRSDLYALGVVLYFCLSGVTPFRGDAVAQIRGHCDGTPPRLASVARTPVPDALLTAVERAMAKLPGDRYADAREMREALEQSVAENFKITRAWLELTPVEGDAGAPAASGEDIEHAPTMAAATPLTDRPDQGAWIGTRSYRQPVAVQPELDKQPPEGPGVVGAVVAPPAPAMVDAAQPVTAAAAPGPPVVATPDPPVAPNRLGASRWQLGLGLVGLVTAGAAVLAWPGQRAPSQAADQQTSGAAPRSAAGPVSLRPAAAVALPPAQPAAPSPAQQASPGNPPTAQPGAAALEAAAATELGLAQEVSAAALPVQAPPVKLRMPRGGSPRPKKQPVIEEIR